MHGYSCPLCVSVKATECKYMSCVEIVCKLQVQQMSIFSKKLRRVKPVWWANFSRKGVPRASGNVETFHW